MDFIHRPVGTFCTWKLVLFVAWWYMHEVGRRERGREREMEGERERESGERGRRGEPSFISFQLRLAHYSVYKISETSWWKLSPPKNKVRNKNS